MYSTSQHFLERNFVGDAADLVSAPVECFAFQSEVVVALNFRRKTECSLCGNVIMDDDEIVAMSHFIADKNDPLWLFSDSAMHRPCFLTWDQRETFVGRFNQLVGGITLLEGDFPVRIASWFWPSLMLALNPLRIVCLHQLSEMKIRRATLVTRLIYSYLSNIQLYIHG